MCWPRLANSVNSWRSNTCRYRWKCEYPQAIAICVLIANATVQLARIAFIRMPGLEQRNGASQGSKVVQCQLLPESAFPKSRKIGAAIAIVAQSTTAPEQWDCFEKAKLR